MLRRTLMAELFPVSDDMLVSSDDCYDDFGTGAEFDIEDTDGLVNALGKLGY